MSNKKFDLFGRLEELPSRVYVIMAIVCLVIHVLLCTYTKINTAVCGLVIIIIYVLAALVIHLTVNKRISLFRLASNASEEQNSGVIYTFRNMLKIPYAVVTENGKIVTVNAAMKNAAGAKATVFNADITDICGIPMENIIKVVSSAEGILPVHRNVKLLAKLNVASSDVWHVVNRFIKFKIPRSAKGLEVG